MKNTDVITHYDPWVIPKDALLAAFNGRIDRAVNGLAARVCAGARAADDIDHAI